MSRRVVSAFAIVPACLFVSTTALALPAYLKNFQGHYGDNGVDVSKLVGQESCGVCHASSAGGGARNAYGEDFKSQVLGARQSFPAIDLVDSDGDGFVNVEEIFVQKAPGSTSDVPAARIELVLEGDVLTVTSPTSCGNLEVNAWGLTLNGTNSVQFPNPTGAVSLTAAKAATQTLVLARCLAESAVGSLAP